MDDSGNNQRIAAAMAAIRDHQQELASASAVHADSGANQRSPTERTEEAEEGRGITVAGDAMGQRSSIASQSSTANLGAMQVGGDPASLDPSVLAPMVSLSMNHLGDDSKMQRL